MINRESPYYRSIQGVYGDILKKVKKEEKKLIKKTVLQIIQEKNQKYLKDFQWKEKAADVIHNNSMMMYDQFKGLHGKSKKLKNLFNYLKELNNIKSGKTTTTINDYLFYEGKELNRKQDICDDLEYDLKGKLENTHVQRVKDLQLQNLTILNELYKIYRNKTRDAIHKMSRYIIDLCKEHDVGTIVIGYNESWKTRSKLSKAVNRRFIPLPFYKLIESIKYKAILCGINIIVQEESYTSKCSALDNESIEFHLNYDGVRNPSIQGKDGKIHKHYGQFYSYKSDKYIHSDVNGAYNIGRKGKPSLFSNIPQIWMLIPPKKIAVT
jgi:IS605 OrfB family transposase